jgi:hypothetical protein
MGNLGYQIIENFLLKNASKDFFKWDWAKFLPFESRSLILTFSGNFWHKSRFSQNGSTEKTTHFQ